MRSRTTLTTAKREWGQRPQRRIASGLPACELAAGRSVTGGFLATPGQPALSVHGADDPEPQERVPTTSCPGGARIALRRTGLGRLVQERPTPAAPCLAPDRLVGVEFVRALPDGLGGRRVGDGAVVAPL